MSRKEEHYRRLNKSNDAGIDEFSLNGTANEMQWESSKNATDLLASCSCRYFEEQSDEESEQEHYRSLNEEFLLLNFKRSTERSK